MGAALAKAALWMGAELTVVAGPQSAVLPKDATIIRVRTAQEMLHAALAHAAIADFIVGVAAVADYRVTNVHDGKLRRTSEPLSLPLTPNPDVIAALAQANPQARVVGFAAEPTEDRHIAREKLARKGLYAIAANDISRSDIGFEQDHNEINLLFQDGSEQQSGRQSKLGCALWLLEQIATSPAR